MEPRKQTRFATAPLSPWRKIPKSKLLSFLHPICQWAPEEAVCPAAEPEQREEENKGVEKVNRDASARL